MTAKFLKGLYADVARQPLQILFILALTISVFLPLYITVPVAIAAFVYFVRDKKKRKAVASAPFFALLAVLSALLLVVPLVYRNYYGFGCGILFIIYMGIDLFSSTVMTEGLFNRICSICCAMSVVCAAAAVVEKVFGFQTRSMAFTYNANFYGYLIELVVVICFYKLVQTKNPWYLAIVAVNVGALFLSDCRSAWSGIFAGLLVLFIMLGRKKSLAGLLILTAVVALAIFIEPSLFPRHSDISPTISNRVSIWTGALRDFAAHPIFGRGLLAYYQVTGNPVTPHAHNILLDLLECTGVVGTGIVIFFFVRIIRQFVDAYRRGGESTRACVALCAGIIAATLAHGVTDMPVMGVQTGLFFFLMLSLRPRLSADAAPAKAVISDFSDLPQVLTRKN